MADARFASGFASQVLEKFCELEELAEEILSDKHQVRINGSSVDKILIQGHFKELATE